MTREEAMYLLNNLRSVAEGKEDKAIDMAVEALQVDIVRCKDCIYSRPAYPILCSKPRGLTSVESEDCFCSYGERRKR